MKLTPDLNGSRLTVARTAELACMHPTHFRRLCRRGIFPMPKRTARRRPYYDYELLATIAQVIKTGVGLNGEEILFYRKTAKRCKTEKVEVMTPYLKDLASVLRQLGVPDKKLTASNLKNNLKQAYGSKWPDLSVAILELNRRLLE